MSAVWRSSQLRCRCCQRLSAAGSGGQGRPQGGQRLLPALRLLLRRVPGFEGAAEGPSFAPARLHPVPDEGFHRGRGLSQGAGSNSCCGRWQLPGQWL